VSHQFGRIVVPFYIYEIPSIKHREERNWATEQEALSALKHVARRGVDQGAPKDQPIILSEKSSGRKLYEGPIGVATKPLPPQG